MALLKQLISVLYRVRIPRVEMSSDFAPLLPPFGHSDRFPGPRVGAPPGHTHSLHERSRPRGDVFFSILIMVSSPFVGVASIGLLWLGLTFFGWWRLLFRFLFLFIRQHISSIFPLVCCFRLSVFRKSPIPTKQRNPPRRFQKEVQTYLTPPTQLVAGETPHISDCTL